MASPAAAGSSRRWKPLAGVYVPDAYDVAYAADGRIDSVMPARCVRARVVVKRRLKDVNRFETRSILKTPKAEYGHMELLEVGKGCGRGCRFCLEGQVYRPVRHRSLDSLRASVAEIAKNGGKRVGLVGACVSDYPWIGDLMKILDEYGVEVSISSLRADSLTEDLVASLQRGGHRTLTMAPEAGTERLREVTRKVISDEQLFAACDLLRRYGIPNLKCYFMIGLPTETREDVAAIPDLAERMLERLRVPGPDGHPFGKLTLSVSSFVPKPWTPFQWAAFDDVRSLEEQARDHQARRAAALRPRRAREPARGRPPGSPRPRRPPARGLHRDGGRSRRRLAPRAPGMGRAIPRSTRASATRRRPFPGITSTSGSGRPGCSASGSAPGSASPPRCRDGHGARARGTDRGCAGGGGPRHRGGWPHARALQRGRRLLRRRQRRARTGAARSGTAISTARFVACPWHGWRWDVTSGANANNPAVRVPCFPVTVEPGEIFVDLP